MDEIYSSETDSLNSPESHHSTPELYQETQVHAGQPGGTMTRTKLQIYCAPQVSQEIREMAQVEHVTIAELVRRALSLYRYARRAAQAGQTLYVGRDGEVLAEILVP